MKKKGKLYIILIFCSIIITLFIYIIYNFFETDRILMNLFLDYSKNVSKDTLMLLGRYFDSKNVFIRIAETPPFNIFDEFKKITNEIKDFKNLDITYIIDKFDTIKEVRILKEKELLFSKSYESSLYDESSSIEYEDKISMIVDYVIQNNKELFPARIHMKNPPDIFKKIPRYSIIFYKVNGYIVVITIEENDLVKIINRNYDLQGFNLSEAVEYILIEDLGEGKTYFSSKTEKKEKILNPDKILPVNDEDILNIRTSFVHISNKVYLEKQMYLPVPDEFVGTIRIGINTNSLTYLRKTNQINTIVSSVIFLTLLIGMFLFFTKQDRLLMQSLANKERYDSLVVMAKQIAHEIRNPLNSLTMIAKNIEYEKEEGNVTNESINLLYDRIYAIDKIIYDFNLVTDNITLNKENINIGELINKIIKNYEKEYPDITFLKNIPDTQAYIDPIRIEQAIRNIIINSIEAVNNNQKKFIEIQLSKIQNDGIEIIVKDNGNGIPESVMNNLFNPFNTTKINGSGLGLTIIKKIIDAHNGTISIKNDKDDGAIVRVIIPVK